MTPSTVVAVLNTKGGSGKSTLATTLAVGLLRHARQYDHAARVLLVDTDAQGTSIAWAAAAAQYGGLDDGLDVATIATAAELRRVRALRDRYAFIVLDGAARAEATVAAAIVEADGVIVPVSPAPADVWGTAQTVRLLAERPMLRAAFVVVQAKPRTSLAASIRAALAPYGLPVLDTATHHRTAWAEQMITGATVLDLSPSHPAHVEAAQLVDDVTAFLHRDR